MRRYKLLLIVFFIAIQNLQAQVNNDFDALKSAYVNVQEGNYGDAYQYFEEMLNLYPKEPIYNYYAGRCLFYLEKDPEKAIQYLRFASTKEVPDDVYYYLGLAYIKNYQFDKALKNLRLFETRANKKQIRELELTNYISIANNALYLTKYIREPLVYSKKDYHSDDFYKNYALDDLEGYFTDAYDFLDIEKDSLSQESVIYVPKRARVIDALYFSKRNEKRGDYDIYTITRLSDTAWSESVNLGDIINTPFDENYAYMHSDGKTLYFASKGHYSMGGYDLYKSTWDWNMQEWTEPENLDFPINSPFDDVLYVSSPNKKQAMFASDREGLEDRMMVYKIKPNSSEPYIELEDCQQLLEYAELSVNEKIEVEKEEKQVENRTTGHDDLVKIKDDEEFLLKSQYDSLLNLAVSYQLSADSLRWLIDEKRQDFDKTSDSKERARLSNVIIELEMSVYSLQKKSDACYVQVREIEQTNLASQKTIYEESKPILKEESKPEKKALNSYIEPEPDTLQVSKLIAEEVIEEDTLPVIDLGLRVETPSIYNSSNPIPVNEILPESVIYMIQLGAFSSQKSPAVFKGLTPLSIIKKENSKIQKYFAGKFLQLSEAEKKLPLVKSKGFRDAYIVAFHKGKIIPVKNAVKLESKEVLMPTKEESVEEVKGLTENELKIIFVIKGKILASDSLSVDSIKLELPEDKEMYLDEGVGYENVIVKSFAKYETAEAILKILKEKGIRETEIHAYFAENQIPLKQARKITK